MREDLRIPLARIPAGGLGLDVEVEAAWLELKEGLWPPVSGLRLIGRLERGGSSEVVFRGRVEGIFRLQCALGLAEFDHRFAEPFDVYFLPPPLEEQAQAGEEIELDEKELEVSYIADESVDLLPPLRDQLGLAIPLQPRCPGECLGENPEICRRIEAGEPLEADAAPDPRWAALRGWKK